MKPINELKMFIQCHDDWYSLLSSDPYNIKIQEHPKYKGMYLFSYHMIRTKWLDENQNIRSMLLACRGLILEIFDSPMMDGSDSCVKVLCHAFDKFFNKNEEAAAKIDWKTATIREKIDGSIIKLWYNPFSDGNQIYDPPAGWTFSTNNTFNADMNLMSVVPVCDEEGWRIKPTKFIHLINFALSENIPELLDLPQHYTFYFELVSPYNRIVIPYKETELYLLGARNNISGQEYDPEQINAQFFGGNFKTPKILEINDPEDIQKIADESGADHEGFVVCDKNFNRIKIKGKEYLYRHHLRGEENFSFKYLFECIKLGSIDDIKGYFVEIAPVCERLENEWSNYYRQVYDRATKILFIWNDIKNGNKDLKMAKKIFAERVKKDFSDIFSLAFNVTKDNSIANIVNEFFRKMDFEMFCSLTGFTC
jgi:hypothetical protein